MSAQARPAADRAADNGPDRLTTVGRIDDSRSDLSRSDPGR